MREADLEHSSKTRSRGTIRLVYTVDCSEIYYTDDHYKTFSFVSKWSINAASNAFWIFFGTSCFTALTFSAYQLTRKKETRDVFRKNVIFSFITYLKIIACIITIPFVLLIEFGRWVYEKNQKAKGIFKMILHLLVFLMCF